MELYLKVEKFIIDSFNKTTHAGDIKHFERTVYWLKQLKPDADEALCIAAFAHDAERAFRDEESTKKVFQIKGFVNKDQVKYHSETGANIIAEFLKKENAPAEFVEHIRQFISKHEIGGTDDENILKDADSISYFENQIPFFLNVMVNKVGKEIVREKFQWMYDRITSEKAKEIALPMYQKAIKELGL
jgi:hypothetical protein